MGFHAVLLSIPPSLLMLLMSFAGYALTVPPMFMSAMQHLAAGLVMCAVAVELCPIVSAAPNDAITIFAIVLGFFGGLAIFLLLGAYCEVDEEDDEDEKDELEATAAPASAADGLAMLRDKLMQSPARPTPTRPRSASDPQSSREKMKAGVTAAAGLVNLLKAFGAKTSKLAQARRLARPASPPFPFAFAVAVCVDAFVDGFLIGISDEPGSSAGIVMSAALTIEMGFLGLTFAAAMAKQPYGIACAAVVVPPVVLVLGGISGALAVDAMSAYPALHVGLVSFGIAALLYLVTEELLLEAHHTLDQAGAEHTWWVDLMFFVGFLGAFLLEKAVDSL